jgi:hypothetical protein
MAGQPGIRRRAAPVPFCAQQSRRTHLCHRHLQRILSPSSSVRPVRLGPHTSVPCLANNSTVAASARMPSPLARIGPFLRNCIASDSTDFRQWLQPHFRNHFAALAIVHMLTPNKTVRVSHIINMNYIYASKLDDSPPGFLILSCLQRSDLVSERVIHISCTSLREVECVPIILRQRDSFLQAQGKIGL